MCVLGVPDGLTSRELQVIEQLALGNSNRQIAEALFISENTVIRHVSNILAKTESSNRTEAGVYAERHGLVQSRKQPSLNKRRTMTTAHDLEPFVGRRRELEILSSALDRARGRSAGAIITVSGEPGIGKTSLARRGTARANEVGFVTGMGRCREQKDAPPLWPWLQSVRAAQREGGETCELPIDCDRATV